jgi:hypothetical protein
MDQVTLVEAQIEEGRRLIDRLAQEGFSVTVAGWIKTVEDGQWFLYLASPVVDSGGSTKAYRRVFAVMRQMPKPFWIHPLEVKLIGSTTPLAEAVGEIQQHYAGRASMWYGGTQLGGVSIEGAYLYLTPSAVPGS